MKLITCENVNVNFNAKQVRAWHIPLSECQIFQRLYSCEKLLETFETLRL